MYLWLRRPARSPPNRQTLGLFNRPFNSHAVPEQAAHPPSGAPVFIESVFYVYRLFARWVCSWKYFLASDKRPFPLVDFFNRVQKGSKPLTCFKNRKTHSKGMRRHVTNRWDDSENRENVTQPSHGNSGLFKIDWETMISQKNWGKNGIIPKLKDVENTVKWGR